MRNRRKKLSRFQLPHKLLFGIAFFSVSALLVTAGFAYKDLLLHKPLIIPLSLRGNNGTARVKKLLQEFDIGYVAVTQTPDSTIHVKLLENEEIILSTKKDLRVQISSLQRILSRLTIEGKRFSRLDLRFDKPLIISSKN